MKNPRHMNSSENKKGKFMYLLPGFNNYSHIAKRCSSYFCSVLFGCKYHISKYLNIKLNVFLSYISLTCFDICHTQSINWRKIGDRSASAWFLSPWPILWNKLVKMIWWRLIYRYKTKKAHNSQNMAIQLSDLLSKCQVSQRVNSIFSLGI